MSGDGSRLICSRHVYDQDLNHIVDLGEEIHATTCDGRIAYGEPSIFMTDTGTVVDTLPFVPEAAAVACDQGKVFIVDTDSGYLQVIPVVRPTRRPGGRAQK
jgi:hypothetical protein